MWKDGNTWSRVGIIPGSTKWDSPKAGYVTFKVSHLTQFAVLANVAGSTTGLRGDINGDGVVDINDVVYEYASVDLGGHADAATIKNRAKELMPTISGSVVNIPSALDDINGDAKITIDDVVFSYAWVDLGSSATATTVKSRATELFSTISGVASDLPAESISR